MLDVKVESRRPGAAQNNRPPLAFVLGSNHRLGLERCALLTATKADKTASELYNGFQ